jgi:YVTN family beta-propeller protein
LLALFNHTLLIDMLYTDEILIKSMKKATEINVPTYIAFSLGEFGKGPALPGFTRDHKQLVIPMELSDNIIVFSLETCRVLYTIPLTSRSRPWQAKISPDNKFCFVTNSNFNTTADNSHNRFSSINVIDLEKQVLVKELQVGAGANGITVDQQGRNGYVVNMRSNSVSVFDVKSQKVFYEIQVGRRPAFAKLTLDGKLLVVTNLQDASVSIINTEKLNVIKTIVVGIPELNDTYPEWGSGDTTGIAISKDYHAYITNYRSHTIVNLNLKDFTFKKDVSPIRFPFFVEIDREIGTVIFSSGVEKKLCALDIINDNWLGVFPNDGTIQLDKKMRTLNLWMTDPSNNRLTAILPNGIDGISKDWERNMVTKFM